MSLSSSEAPDSLPTWDTVRTEMSATATPGYGNAGDILGSAPSSVNHSKVATVPNAELRHVLFLIDRFPHRVGGAEGVLLRTIRRLPANRYRCSVATFAVDPQFGDARRLFDCPFYLFPLQRTYDWNAMRVAVKIMHLIRSQQVSIVHTFFSTSDLWGGLIAKLSGCPVLISSRRDMGIQRSAKHQLAYRLLGGMFDQIQAVSDEVRAFSISQDALNRGRVVTLHNGVDLEEIQQACGIPRSDPTLALQQASHVIATVGNIRPVKGTDVLVRAAALVSKQFPLAAFLVIGGVQDHEYFRSLQQLAASLGITRSIRFVGLRYDVVSILKSCDVFYQSSRSEGLPNAILEAMACRLPCVATDVGGTREVVADGRSGFLVPPENPELAAERLLRLLRDPKLAREMGETGFEIIEEHFTSRVMVNRLVEHYDSILEAKRYARLSQ
jgi:glycosyltransferase involved in cell wall biosynthesis